MQPTGIVQMKLRIPEDEHRKLEEAAERNGVTMNAEALARLARTFRDQATLEIDQLVENTRRYLGPLLADAHELGKAGDLMRVADALVALVQPGPAGEAVVERYNQLKRMIEVEARLRLRKMSAEVGGTLP